MGVNEMELDGCAIQRLSGSPIPYSLQLLQLSETKNKFLESVLLVVVWMKDAMHYTITSEHVFLIFTLTYKICRYRVIVNE